jgi:hypothetical protein
VNPDEKINVVVVYPNGLAVYYGHADALGVRPRLRSEQFKNYGEAVLAAQEYEAKQREEKAKRAK